MKNDNEEKQLLKDEEKNSYNALRNEDPENQESNNIDNNLNNQNNNSEHTMTFRGYSINPQELVNTGFTSEELRQAMDDHLKKNKGWK